MQQGAIRASTHTRWRTNYLLEDSIFCLPSVHTGGQSEDNAVTLVHEYRITHSLPSVGHPLYTCELLLYMYGSAPVLALLASSTSDLPVNHPDVYPGRTNVPFHISF